MTLMHNYLSISQISQADLWHSTKSGGVGWEGRAVSSSQGDIGYGTMASQRRCLGVVNGWYRTFCTEITSGKQVGTCYKLTNTRIT